MYLDPQAGHTEEQPRNFISSTSEQVHAVMHRLAYQSYYQKTVANFAAAAAIVTFWQKV